MGFYIRKSVRLGPFRFNLSKSGVGVSVGVPGFRIGMSPRGNYVHMGANGLYYRTTIPNGSGAPRGAKSSVNLIAPSTPVIPNVEMTEIDSANTATIVDSDSADLVSEMNAKRKMLSAWPFVLAGGIALFAYSSSQEPSASWVSQAIFIVLLIATGVTAFFDKLRKTTILMFDLDGDPKSRFESLCSTFELIGKSGGRWHVSASGRVSDRKYHAGASTLIQRKSISIGSGPPRFVKTNVPVPSVPVGSQTLYFFPDKVLVFEANAVGAVSYSELNIDVQSSRFVEDGSVPRDAQIVGTTWKFVNKKGGPDKRFKNNRQLPIALYEEISFGSRSGLNELIQVSKVGFGKIIRDKIAMHAKVSG